MSAETYDAEVVAIMERRIGLLQGRLHTLIQFARGNQVVLDLIHEALEEDRRLGVEQLRAAASGGGGERG